MANVMIIDDEQAKLLELSKRLKAADESLTIIQRCVRSHEDVLKVVEEILQGHTLDDQPVNKYSDENRSKTGLTIDAIFSDVDTKLDEKSSGGFVTPTILTLLDMKAGYLLIKAAVAANIPVAAHTTVPTPRTDFYDFDEFFEGMEGTADKSGARAFLEMESLAGVYIPDDLAVIEKGHAEQARSWLKDVLPAGI
ncbi:hypothetical protein GC177_06515 [bacterium]|nr:hypothetical protein [bacterium]